MVTPLESPAIYGGGRINNASIPSRKGGVYHFTSFKEEGLGKVRRRRAKQKWLQFIEIIRKY
jgi:hypothetical protein